MVVRYLGPYLGVVQNACPERDHKANSIFGRISMKGRAVPMVPHLYGPFEQPPSRGTKGVESSLGIVGLESSSVLATF